MKQHHIFHTVSSYEAILQEFLREAAVPYRQEGVNGSEWVGERREGDLHTVQTLRGNSSTGRAGTESADTEKMRRDPGGSPEYAEEGAVLSTGRKPGVKTGVKPGAKRRVKAIF